MEAVKKVAEKLGVLPKIQLGIKLIKPDGKPGGIKSTGAHRVKFLAEPTLVMGKTFEGQPRQELRFEVEEKGIKYRWNVPILNKDTKQPSYLIERLMEVQIGDERILELVSRGSVKYIDVRLVDEAQNEPPEEVEPEEEDHEESEK